MFIVGNCVQAPKGAVHRRQKIDTKLSHARAYRVPKSIGVEEGTFGRWKLSLTTTVMSHTMMSEGRSHHRITRKPRAYLKKIIVYYLVQHAQDRLFPVSSKGKSRSKT